MNENRFNGSFHIVTPDDGFRSDLCKRDGSIDMSVGACGTVGEQSADDLFGSTAKKGDTSADSFFGNDDLDLHIGDDSDLTVNIGEEERDFVFIGDRDSVGSHGGTSQKRATVSPSVGFGLIEDDVLDFSGGEILGFGPSYANAESYQAPIADTPDTKTNENKEKRANSRGSLDSAYADFLSYEDKLGATDRRAASDRSFSYTDLLNDYPDPDVEYGTAPDKKAGGVIYPDLDLDHNRVLKRKPEGMVYPDPDIDYGTSPDKNAESTCSDPQDADDTVSEYEMSFIGISRNKRLEQKELYSFGNLSTKKRDERAEEVQYDDPDDTLATAPDRTKAEELAFFGSLKRRNEGTPATDGKDKPPQNQRIKAEKSRDIDLVVARDAFERAQMGREYEHGKMRFGKMTFGEERELVYLKRELGAARRRLRHAKSAERHDNDRYYYAISRLQENLKPNRVGDRERLSALIAQADGLLSKRDEINRQLIGLYRGGMCKGRATGLRKMAEIERRASLREYRRLRPMARELARRGTSGLKRQEVYTLMDERVRLVGKLAVLDWRIWHEKMSRMAKKEIKKERRDMRQDLQDNAILLNRHSERALIDVRRHSRANMSTVLGIIGLVLLVAAVFLVWYYREPIIGFLRDALSGLISKIPESLPENAPEDGAGLASFLEGLCY